MFSCCFVSGRKYLSRNKLLWVISASLIWTQSLFRWQARRTALSKRPAIIHAANHARGWQLGTDPNVCFHLGAIQTKPWVLGQAPNERSRELEVGYRELIHLDNPGLQENVFPWNPNTTAEEKESTLRSNCFSEMYSVTSTRLLSPKEHSLTALPFRVWGRDEIMKCWKHYFQLFFQLGNLCCQCTFATTPLLLLLLQLLTETLTAPHNLQIYLFPSTKYHYNTSPVFAVMIEASAWPCWQIFGDLVIVKEWVMQENVHFMHRLLRQTLFEGAAFTDWHTRRAFHKTPDVRRSVQHSPHR